MSTPIPPAKAPSSRDGLSTLNASGSAQYCKGQLQAMPSKKSVRLPMTIVDLRSFASKSEIILGQGQYRER